MSKQIYFRVDSNYDIGNGHLARCINLANIIKKIGHKAIFITKYRNKNTIKFERKFNFVYINKFKNINSEINFFVIGSSNSAFWHELIFEFRTIVQNSS